jgi:phosphatidylserine/phosphatidylglycerophosphate/cardiolipin synthase-like enzyme
VSSVRRLPADRIIVEPSLRRAVLLDALRGARTGIAISLFRCDEPAILEELASAVERGVAVDVLVTSRSRERKKLSRLWDALEATGATVHPFADPVIKYHAKYLVVDDGPAVIASLNFTRKCFSRTLDALVITYDPDVIMGLRELLAADREGGELRTGVAGRLIVGPERARAQLRAIVEGARHSIRVIDPKLSDPAFLALFDARRAEGLRVDVYREPRLLGLKSHGKIMLVDDRLAVVGGLAMTPLSLDFRREVAVTVTQARAVTVVRRLFKAIAPPRERHVRQGPDFPRAALRDVRARSMNVRLPERS